MIDESLAMSLRQQLNDQRAETVNFFPLRVVVMFSLLNIAKIHKLPHGIAQEESEDTTRIDTKNNYMLHFETISRIYIFFAFT